MCQYWQKFTITKASICQKLLKKLFFVSEKKCQYFQKSDGNKTKPFSEQQKIIQCRLQKSLKVGINFFHTKKNLETKK